MNILMVIPTFFPVVGGAERQLEGLVAKLCEHGNNIAIITRKLPGAKVFEVNPCYSLKRLSTFGFRFGFHVSMLFYLALNVRKFGVIHCHTLSGPAFLCVLMGSIFNVPVVLKVTRSGPGSQIRNWRSRRYKFLLSVKWMWRTAFFVAISKDTLGELADIGIPEEKCTLIPNGVDIPLELPVRCGDTISIIYTGRLIARKSVDVLIRAFSRLSNKGNCKLVIVGDGPEFNALQLLARELNLQAYVEFTGQLCEGFLRDRLLSSDIFVLPSLSEGMSNSLLEAMAYGLAIVVRDIEANKELICHERNGLLFHDESALKVCLERLMADASFRYSISEQARLSAIQSYAFSSVSEAYNRLYCALSDKAV